MSKERIIPDRSEYIQPALMGAASLLNIMGSGVAIFVGADRTQEGKVNPFFYTALTTSVMYLGANVFKMGQIYQARSWVETEDQRRLHNEQIKLIEKCPV